MLYACDKETARDIDQDRIRENISLIKTLILQGVSPQGAAALGDCDDIQTTGTSIFILAGDIHRGYRLMAHFSHTQASWPFLDCLLQEASHKQAAV